MFKSTYLLTYSELSPSFLELSAYDWLYMLGMIDVCSAAKQPTVPQAIDITGDVTVAREAAGCVAYVRRTAKQFLHLQTLMTSCVKHLM